MQCCGASCTHSLLGAEPMSFLYCRFLSRSDSVTLSVWNNRKVHRREGAGFLGCVRLAPSIITRLRDTGCELSTCINIGRRQNFVCVCVLRVPALTGVFSDLPSSPRPATEPYQEQP